MTKNRWMAAMTLFVAVFYSLVLISNHSYSRSPAASGEAAEKTRLMEELKQKELRAEKNLRSNPALLDALSRVLAAALFLGVLLDGWLLGRWKKGDPWRAGAFSVGEVRWGAGEVAGGFVFLLFVEACVFLTHEVVRSLMGTGKDLPDGLIFATSILRDLIVAVFVWGLIKTRHGRGLQELGLRSQKIISQIGMGLAGYLAILPLLLLTFGAVAVVTNFFSVEAPPQNVVQTYLKESSSGYLVLLTVLVALVGPLLEELFFRGFAYAGLRRRFGVWGAASVSAVSFATLHMNGVAFAPIFVLGLFLAFLYEVTGSLVPCITAHTLHNGIMVALTLGFKSLSS